MKTLGLIGGTSWHSTIEYYKYINQYVNDHFGDNTNPPLLVYTLNHSLIREYQAASNWNGIAQLVTEAGLSLERAGAEKLLLCANTSHKVYNEVEEKLKAPILHIADATAAAVKSAGLSKVCFIGTKYTMVEGFITQRIAANGIEVSTPTAASTIDELHRIIQKELTYGNVEAASKDYVIEVVKSLVSSGAEGAILGCTEFPLLIQAEDLSIPIFNTTTIHAKAGAEFILGKWK